ncbi:hypothetical protein LIER_15391 [Lithospermum erythrorhizon]|uniref:Myb/SANT-like domain-containing protein n=1 Tax=Lithospermum erythrorhizon TaxID=34254 RepID=A0AAV3Q3N2_LITER
MGKQIQDQQQGFNSNPRWSPDEESTFLDMLVEEFINKQPEAMDALIALVLFRISKITDKGWNRVAIRLTERIGKKYTTAELKEQMKRFTQRFQCMENLFGQGGPGMNFPRTTFEPYSEHDNDGGVYWTPEVSHQEEGLNMDSPYATSEPYFEHSNDTGVYWSPDENFPYPGDCVRNSYRSSDNGSHQDGRPGIRESPIEKNSIPEKEVRNSDGCNGSVPYLDKTVGNINRNCGNVVHQEGGPDTSFHHTKFVPSHEHDSDAGICHSPVESVSIPEKDSRNSVGCNDSVPYPEESIRSSNRRCGDVNPQEDFVDSGVNPSVSCPKECEDAEENVEDSGVNPNVSCPKECEDAEENVGDSGVNPNVSCPEECEDAGENVEGSGVNDNVYHTRDLDKAAETAGESEGSKRSDAEKKYPLDSIDYKKNKWSSYSEAKSTCGVSQNPDDGDSFSFARCRNILHGMRRIDSQFRDTALDLLEDQYYRKFFMQMKHDKRLDWLSSILGMEH